MTGARTSPTTARAFAYDLENRLLDVSGSAAMTLQYDPLGRLRTTIVDGAPDVTTTFLYAGDQLVAEYDTNGDLDARYAFGAGVDRPLVWYEGEDFTNPNWLHADELGSVIATSDEDGNATVYAYGPYGEPDATHGWTGVRFRYTGQIMLPEAQLYHYKARVYDPALGRFLQTDPVGYDAGSNLYAYVGNDPLNATDPLGLSKENQFDDRSACEGNVARYEAGWRCLSSQASGASVSRQKQNSAFQAPSASEIPDDLPQEVIIISGLVSQSSSKMVTVAEGFGVYRIVVSATGAVPSPLRIPTWLRRFIGGGPGVRPGTSNGAIITIRPRASNEAIIPQPTTTRALTVGVGRASTFNVVTNITGPHIVQIRGITAAPVFVTVTQLNDVSLWPEY